MKKTILLSVLASLCLFFRARAQSATSTSPGFFTGIVRDETGHPLPGATLKLSNSHALVLADNNGKFTITVSKLPDTLSVSFIGFETSKVAVGPNTQSPVYISLKPYGGSLNEVQIIGLMTYCSNQRPLRGCRPGSSNNCRAKPNFYGRSPIST